MMLSAKRWIGWTYPFRTHLKRVCLLAVMGLFATAHLLTSTTPEQQFTDLSLSSASCASVAGGELDAVIESSESSVSMEVALRDASYSLEQPHKSRFAATVKMSGLRCFLESGTTGPPSVPNNNTIAAA